MNVERLETELNEAFMTVVHKNEELTAFAGKMANPRKKVHLLESYLEVMAYKNDKTLISARITAILLTIKKVSFLTRDTTFALEFPH